MCSVCSRSVWACAVRVCGHVQYEYVGMCSRSVWACAVRVCGCVQYECVLVWVCAVRVCACVGVCSKSGTACRMV